LAQATDYAEFRLALANLLAEGRVPTF